MSFLNLLKREAFWLLKSPALIWSFFPLLLLIHLFIILLWVQSGLTVPLVEGMWGVLGTAWAFGIKSQIEENFMAAQILAPYIPIMDEILRLPAKELWPRFIVPSLQAFSLFPLGTLIPPLAVTLFQRDLDHGAFRQLSMNGTHCLAYLISKLIILCSYSFLLNFLCLGITLTLYQNIPEREQWFHFFTTPWLLCHMAGVGFGACIAVVSWWGCLGSRNGCTEIYVACAIGAIGTNGLLFTLYSQGLNTSSLIYLTFGLFLSAPLGLIFLWLRMRQASFILNH